MALVTKPAITVSIEYIDATGSKGSSTLYLPSATTLAAAITKLDATAALITAVSDCAIIGYSIATGKIDTATPAPIVGSRVENRAEFTLRTAAAKLARFSFPSPKSTILNASGGILSTLPAVAALQADLIGGYTDSNGSALTSVVSDTQIFQRTSVKQMTTDTNPTV
jgi:hypothetical protein